MPNPPRADVAGQVYNDLRALARREGRSTDEVMVEYVLERFLFRLAASPLGGRHFVLKGGLLLAQFGARRMTRDIDILGRAFPGDDAEIIRRIAGIAETVVEDGVAFDPASLRTVPIRQDDEYHGLRLSMASNIARARLKLQLDVSFGDPITPAPRLIDYPQQLAGGSFQLYGYPLATVIAEKVVTAVSLGALNTRDRDYADIYRLISLNNLNGDELTAAVRATAEHRGVILEPLSSRISDLPVRRQSSYSAWIRRQGRTDAGHPPDFVELTDLVTTFADPLVVGKAAGRTWDAERKAWN
ncbi:nucleotidyl transferase AbiEii/AbiGii toxin family protein [Streptosporangium sp. NPDC049248]|uniref:nucleotidyl transferase AbiEii/AbiGii toxin family protein n=1 Tax=Streptosporangium sp. NPDC049248 TaxID=3155651 RepID=UPI00343E90D7